MYSSKLDSPPILGIVVPCFNEQEIIEYSCVTLETLICSFITRRIVDEKSFVLFLDDGSTDLKVELLKSVMTKKSSVVKLAKNVGHQNALIAGMHFVTGKVDCMISVDSDLQDDISAFEKMLSAFRSGKHIVYGVRIDRMSDKLLKRTTARLFYFLMNRLGVKLVKDHADCRLLSDKALKELAKYSESNIFLRGIVTKIGLPSDKVCYVQRRRGKGYSKYTSLKMISLAFCGITAFSNYPLRLITWCGCLLFFLSVLMSIYVLGVLANGLTVPGWASTVLAIYLLGGIQLLSIGILGEYIARIYSETKRRPLYHIEDVISSGPDYLNEKP